MPLDATAAENVLTTALSADLNNLVLVIVLVLALAYVLLIWLFRLTQISAGKAAAGGNALATLLVESTTRSTDRLASSLDQLSTALDRMSESQNALMQRLEILGSDQRHDASETQSRLAEIKKQLDVMSVDLSAVRAGMDVNDGTHDA